MILGYLRVSTDDQKNNTSPESQEQIIRGVAMTCGASSFDVQIFSDLGVSGSIPLEQRPGGKKLLATARSGDTVCAAKLDRMFRSASDALVTAESMKARGIKLILFDLGSKPVTENEMAKCFFTMASAFAELERARIAERMRTGRQHKRARNGHIGGLAPYGYRVVGAKKQASLEPDEQEQPVLKEVLDLAGQELTTGRIARIINNKGYRNRVGAPFACMQVKRIIAYARAH
jgi:DNA invertase Pin-like site-specific DNA recombinase